LAIVKNRFSISFLDYLKEPDFAYLVANNLVFLLRSLQIYFQSPRFVLVRGRLKYHTKEKNKKGD